MIKAFFLCTILLMSLPLSADNQWKLRRNQDDIKVYSRSSANGYDEVRATTRVKTTVSAFIALLHDTAHVPDWMESVSGVTVIQVTGQRSNLVHTRFQAPWPVANRDMVTFSEYRQPTPCSLELTISDRQDAIPKMDGYIRITDVWARWTLAMQPNDDVEIDYQAHANTSGNLPRWMANQASLHAAFKTFQALRIELTDQRYQEEVIDGILECPGSRRMDFTGYPAQP